MSEGYLNAGIKQLETYEKETALTNEPLSAGEAISEITPYPIGITPVNISSENPGGLRPRVRDVVLRPCYKTLPDTPNACNTLRPRSSLYDFACARQMSA